jgi:hypothetical protein
VRLQTLRAFCWITISMSLQGGMIAAAQVTGRVSGLVRYGDTGEPASGIRLWLTSAQEAVGIHLDQKTGDYVVKDKGGENALSTQAAPDGTFTLKGVPPGRYLIHTYSPPYISPDDTVYPTSDAYHVAVGSSPSSDALQVEVGANQSVNLGDILLQRGGSIEGAVRFPPSVVSAPGASLAGFAVNAERKLGENRYARAGIPAHTDAQGHYQLDGLAPGDYIVFVGMGGELPVYSFGTVRPSQAAVVRIQQSEAHHLDVELSSTTGLHRIERSVTIEGPEPAQNALVRLYPLGEGGLTAAKQLTATHSFSFQNVPDGDYTIEVEFPPSSKVVSVDVAEGLIHMRMTPSPYATATRNIHVADHDLSAVLLRATHR